MITQSRARITWIWIMIFASPIYTLRTLWSVSQGYLQGREGEIRSKYAIYVPAIVCLACHNLSRIASVTLLSAHRIAVPVVSIVAYLPRYYRRYAGKGARENEKEYVCVLAYIYMCEWGGNSFLLTITPLLLSRLAHTSSVNLLRNRPLRWKRSACTHVDIWMEHGEIYIIT